VPTPEDEAWPHLLALKNGSHFDPSRLSPAAHACWTLYAPIAGSRGSFTVAQLGQSLDGRIATPTGHSHYVNGPEAIRHLHRLRALVDAVVVGVGTVVADDPLLTVRRVEGPSPARVIIDPSGRLPHTARLLGDDGVSCFVVQTADRTPPPGASAIALATRDGHFTPASIIAALAERGFHRLLIEGGGRTVSAFLAARALDRLHVAVAPLIIGSGPTGIELPAIDRLDAALRPTVALHRLGDDVLFDCALARSR
jgi:riboflavin-specific deaminase-like protein